MRRSLIMLLSVVATGVAIAPTSTQGSTVFTTAAAKSKSGAHSHRFMAKYCQTSCQRRVWRKQHPQVRPPALRYYHLDSTAYCDSGIMANGKTVHDGAVAVVRGWSLGHWYQIRSGPLKGKVVHGEDHIGYGSQFDIWMSGGCNQYGRRSIVVAEISRYQALKARAAQHK